MEPRSVRTERRLPHLGRPDLQLAPAQVDPTGHQNDRVRLDQVWNGLVHAGERDHLDAAGEPLEPELRVRLTTLRVLAGKRPDDAPDGDEIPVAEVGHLIDRVARLRPELVLHPQPRMVAHDLAEHLLLLREEEPLVELVPGEDPLVDLAEPGAVRARAEERELAG